MSYFDQIGDNSTVQDPNGDNFPSTGDYGPVEIVTTTVDIPLFLVGWVIGRGGRRIQELQQKTNCKIWMDQNKPSSADNSKILNVEGTAGHVQFALSEIADLLSSAPIVASEGGGAASGIVTEVLSCPQPLLGLLIGRNGWTLKRIIRVSGASITINQSVLPTQPRRVIIYGKPECVSLAKSLVERVLTAQSQSAAESVISKPYQGYSDFTDRYSTGQSNVGGGARYPRAMAPPGMNSDLYDHQQVIRDQQYSGSAAMPIHAGSSSATNEEQMIQSLSQLSIAASGGAIMGGLGHAGPRGAHRNTHTQTGSQKAYVPSIQAQHRQPPPTRRATATPPAPPAPPGSGYIDHKPLAYLHKLQQVQNLQMKELREKQQREREALLHSMSHGANGMPGVVADMPSSSDITFSAPTGAQDHEPNDLSCPEPIANFEEEKLNSAFASNPYLGSVNGVVNNTLLQTTTGISGSPIDSSGGLTNEYSMGRENSEDVKSYFNNAC